MNPCSSREKEHLTKKFQNVQREMKAKKNTWLQWYAKAKAFHNKVSLQASADVLKMVNR